MHGLIHEKPFVCRESVSNSAHHVFFLVSTAHEFLPNGEMQDEKEDKLTPRTCKIEWPGPWYWVTVASLSRTPTYRSRSEEGLSNFIRNWS